MLDNQDIQNLMKAFEEVFPSKTDFENFKDEMKGDFSDLQKSVDAYAEKADKYFQEHTMLSGKVDRNERWIKHLAQKTETKLEY